MSGSSEAVYVRQQADGFWRWRWVAVAQELDEESASAPSLVSYQAFDSVDEAVESARQAYPDLIPQWDPAHRPSRPMRGLLVLALAFLAVLRGLPRSP